MDQFQSPFSIKTNEKTHEFSLVSAENDTENSRGILYHSYRNYSNGMRIEGLIKCPGIVKLYTQKREGYKYDGYFVPDDTKLKSYHIVSDPGVLYNGNLWLEKENDELARSIFVAEAQKKKEAVMDKIEKLKDAYYSAEKMVTLYQMTCIYSADEMDLLFSAPF